MPQWSHSYLWGDFGQTTVISSQLADCWLLHDTLRSIYIVDMIGHPAMIRLNGCIRPWSWLEGDSPGRVKPISTPSGFTKRVFGRLNCLNSMRSHNISRL
jgi:hypothetical protein